MNIGKGLDRIWQVIVIVLTVWFIVGVTNEVINPEAPNWPVWLQYLCVGLVSIIIGVIVYFIIKLIAIYIIRGFKK